MKLAKTKVENQSRFSRRGILAGLAAVTLPTGALALATSRLEEGSELMALAGQTLEVEKRYTDALAAFRHTWNTWSPMWPLAPDCLIDDMGGGFGFEVERNIIGEGLIREGKERSLRLYDEKLLNDLLELSEKALTKKYILKSRKGRLYHEEQIQKCKLGLELLPGYRAECERIKEESGIAKVKQERHDARDAVYAHARTMLEMPSRTPVGAKAKAEAARLIGVLHRYDQTWGSMKDTTDNPDGKPLAALMAEAMCSTMADVAT